MRHQVREETASNSIAASTPNIPQNITNFIGQDASNQLIQLAEQDLLDQVKAHMARSADLQAIKNNIRLNSLTAQFPRVVCPHIPPNVEHLQTNTPQNTVLVVVTNIVDARNPRAVNKRYMVNSLLVDNGAPDKYQVVYATDAQEITVPPNAAIPTPTVKNRVESFTTTTTTTLEPTETQIFPPPDPSSPGSSTSGDPNGTNSPGVNNPDANNPDANNPGVNNPLNNPPINDPNATPNLPTFLPPGATPGAGSPITTIPDGVTSPFSTIPGGTPITTIPGSNPLTTIPGGVTSPLIPGGTTFLPPTTLGGIPPTTFGGIPPTTFGNTFGTPAIITTQTITNIIPLTTFSLSTFTTTPSLFLDPTTAFLLPFASLPPSSTTALILPSDPANLIFANQVDLLSAACLGLNGLGGFGGQQHLFGSAEQALAAQLAVLLQGQQQGLVHGGVFPPVVLGGSTTTHGVSGLNGGVPVEGVLVNGVRFRVVEGGTRVQVEKGEGVWEEVKNKA